MKYSISINQKAVIDNGWFILKANHMAVIDVISSMILSKNFKEMNDIYGQWFWVSPKLIVKELPMFDIGDRRCVQLIDDLVTCGLIEKNPDNQALNRTFIRMGPNYSKLIFGSLQENDSAMKNISDVPMKNISDVPMKNISDNNSINNNNTIDNKYYIDQLSENSYLEAKKENKEIKNKESLVKIEKSELEKTFDDFLQMRKSIRKPATEKAIQLLKEKIKKLAQGSEKMAIDILNQSIVNSWQDVFPLKLENKQFQVETKPETPLRRKAL